MLYIVAAEKDFITLLVSLLKIIGTPATNGGDEHHDCHKHNPNHRESYPASGDRLIENDRKSTTYC